MPIVTIECVVDDNEPTPDTAALQVLADQLGILFDSPAASTWVRLRRLPRSDWAENEAVLPPDARPTLVELLFRMLPDEEDRIDQARTVAAVVAKALARPQENVHIIYAPAGAGRIAFGGELVRGPDN